MKKIKLGWREIDINSAHWVYGFKSLIDYDPNSSNINDAVGDHFDIYKEESEKGYLFKFRIRGQEAFAMPAYTAVEGFFPIPKDIALLLMNRNNKDITIKDTKEKHETIIEELYLWLDDIKQILINNCELGDDLFNDLREMMICFNAQAYRGCLALAGVVLERTIKYSLNKNKIEYDNNWMVGNLIKALEKTEYIDPSMKNIWNIINIQRIIGVHAKEQITIPSKDQTAMVIFAIKDTINRTFNFLK